MNLLTTQDVLDMFRVTKPTIIRWMNKDEFPLPVKTPGGQNRWVEREILLWQELMIECRDESPRKQSKPNPFVKRPHIPGVHAILDEGATDPLPSPFDGIDVEELDI